MAPARCVAADARSAIGRALTRRRRSPPPRNFRTLLEGPAGFAPTRARPRAGAPASETSDRSQPSPRRAAPTGGPMPHGGKAPSATTGRALEGSRPPAMRPRRIRQRHEGRQTRRTALRPDCADQPGGSVRLKGGLSGVSTTMRTRARRGEDPAKPPRLLLPSRRFY